MNFCQQESEVGESDKEVKPLAEQSKMEVSSQMPYPNPNMPGMAIFMSPPSNFTPKKAILPVEGPSVTVRRRQSWANHHQAIKLIQEHVTKNRGSKKRKHIEACFAEGLKNALWGKDEGKRVEDKYHNMCKTFKFKKILFHFNIVLKQNL